MDLVAAQHCLFDSCDPAPHHDGALLLLLGEESTASILLLARQNQYISQQDIAVLQRRL
jgi:hypothetical protein